MNICRRSSSRRNVILLICLLLILLPVEGDSLTATGDFYSQVNLFSKKPVGEGTEVVVYLQLPVEDLAWVSVGDSLVCRVGIDLSFNQFGQEVAAIHEELQFFKGAEAEQFQSAIVGRNLILPPAVFRIELTCRDLGRKIGGLPGGMFSHRPTSTLSERITVRDLSPGGGLSDLLLYTFSGEGWGSSPNPAGVYVVGDPWLEVGSDFIPPAEIAEGDEKYFTLDLKIKDSSRRVQFQSKGGWRYLDTMVPLHFKLPLAGLEVGEYTLEAVLAGPRITSRSYSRPFMIIGAVGPADKELSRRSIEAQLFLGSEEFKRWLMLPHWNRVDYMRRFWKGKDPNTATAENEIYDEFLRRFEISQARYSIFHPGALSDRGRMLIRYGEPDEIQVDVVPENHTALINVVRGLHGREAVPPGNNPLLEEIDIRNTDLDRDLRSIGAGNSLSLGNDSEAFEVWIYELDGDPLLPEYDLSLAGVGLKLIFADLNGYGDYELLFRSEDFDF